MTTKVRRRDGSTKVRRWRRFQFDVPVRVTLRRNARDLEFAGRGTGMNEGGIAIDLEEPLQVGNLVQVEFRPPYAGLPVYVRGAVRHAAGKHYGVEFVAADEAEREEVGLFRRMLRAASDWLGE